MDKIVGDIVEASNVYIRCCENYWKNKIEQLQAENKQMREQIEKLAGERLLIDNYCRINDIDIEQALKEKDEQNTVD